MKGHYEHYPVSVRLLEKHRFCTLDEFQIFIKNHEYVMINSKFQRNNIFSCFQKLRIRAPFSKTTRFSDNFYVHMDYAKIRTISKQLLDALRMFNLWQENQVECPSANIMEYINNLTVVKQPYEAAFSQLVDISISTNMKHLEKNGIYCRETFEEIYGLTWIATD